MDNSEFQPWPEDEIEFLEGDWEIRRDGNTPGMYLYSLGGTRSLRAVDAVQLLEWKMARHIRYEAHTPWEGADIEFLSDDILRDLTDTSSPIEERKYFVCVRGELLRVNRFYLVEEKLATGGETFRAAVSSVHLAASDKNKLNPWAEDDICFTPKAGVGVERSMAMGLYRVSRDGMTVTWDAARLIEEGLACSAYEKKLAVKTSMERFSFSELRTRTHDFWMCADAEEIDTLHEIALIWKELSDPSSERARGMVGYYRARRQAAAAALAAKETRQAARDAALEEYAALKQKLSSTLQELEKEQKACLAYNGCAYARIDGFEGHLKNFEQRKADATALVKSICFFDFGEETEERSDALFPVELLPQVLVRGEIEKLAGEIREAEAAARMEPVDFSAENITLLAETSEKMNALSQEVEKVRQYVASQREIRDKIDAIGAALGGAAFVPKRHLFDRTWKEDNILLITAAKIKKGTQRGTYVVSSNGKEYTLDARDLVYLKLARPKG